MTSPQPGWYQDPLNPDRQKWWDGRNWTTYTMPLASSSPESGPETAGEPATGQFGYGPAGQAEPSGNTDRSDPSGSTDPSDGTIPSGGFSPVNPGVPKVPERYEVPAAFDGPAGADGVPSYPGSHGYPGGAQQAYPPYQGASAQQPGYTDPAGHAGYQGYQQGYAGSHPAYSGYPGYQGYSGYPQAPRASNPLALTGFILGIASLFLFFIPVIGTVVGLAAGVFSAVGLSNQRGRAPLYKVFGIIGLVLGIIFTLLSLLILAAVFSLPYSY